jgi:hypothetical protein
MANTMLYAAVYKDLNSALMDMDELHVLHSRELIGKYDAAVIDKVDGKPHIAKRMDNPTVRMIPELVGTGMLPRKELKQAAADLQANEAELIVIGEPTVAQALGKALTRSVKTVEREFDTSADELAGELAEAFKS